MGFQPVISGFDRNRISRTRSLFSSRPQHPSGAHSCEAAANHYRMGFRHVPLATALFRASVACATPRAKAEATTARLPPPSRMLKKAENFDPREAYALVRSPRLTLDQLSQGSKTLFQHPARGFQRKTQSEGSRVPTAWYSVFRTYEFTKPIAAVRGRDMNVMILITIAFLAGFTFLSLTAVLFLFGTLIVRSVADVHHEKPIERALDRAPCDQALPTATRGGHERAIRDRLLEFGKSISPDELTPTLDPEAAKLLAESAFAFILAVCLDRGTKAEIVWTIPYWLRAELGHFNPKRMSQMTIKELGSVVARLPKKPRYVRDAPRTISELARSVAEDFGGDAELIWRGRTAQEVKRFLMKIHGVAEGIASMGVVLLERCRGARFSDRSDMNVKPDVHVQRVLYRLGVAAGLGGREAVGAAARLNPEYPGDLDPALWLIGRRWCKEVSPDCPHCHMNALCLKAGL
jgi:endonuclease III